MKKFVLCFFYVCLLFLSFSCDYLSDNESGSTIFNGLPDTATEFIETHYPDHHIQSIEIEDFCDDAIAYEVELEDGPGPDVDLYFSLEGAFLFAATDIGMEDLPDAVVNTIESEFSEYTIGSNDLERFELADGGIQYEVKLMPASGSSLEVIFNADGTIYCQEQHGDNDDSDNDNDSNENDTPIDTIDVPDSIWEYVEANYSAFHVESLELEDFCDDVSAYEVELEDGPEPDIDLYFSLEGEFLFAAMDISLAELPDAIRAAIDMEYSSYDIEEDDLKRFELSDGTIQYEVKLEPSSGSGSDIEVVFNADGTIYCLDD